MSGRDLPSPSRPASPLRWPPSRRRRHAHFESVEKRSGDHFQTALVLGILHILTLGFGDCLPAAPQTDHVDAVGEGFHVVGRRGSRGAPVSEPAEDDFMDRWFL